jgi:DNA modification methylase
MTPYWTDGSVTLYHGDCRVVTEWLTADVLVTDPPYGRNLEFSHGLRKGSPERGKRIAGDASTEMRDHVLTQWSRPAVAFGDLMLPPPPRTKQVLIYAKSPVAGVMGTFGGFRRDVEAVYLIGPWTVGFAGRSAVLTSGARTIPATRYGHPHAKPVDVMETLIAACPPGVIADPFAGSGSTLIAARHQGRHAIGVEIDERYCELAARRLDQGVLTISEGKSFA